MQNKKPELLAPAGDAEKLKMAVAYGADAVYLGGQQYGLRAKAKNFDLSAMADSIAYAHKHRVRVYITANIFAQDEDFDGLSAYFRQLGEMGADALIIADPGVFALARKVVPHMELHISTQANTTNYHSVLFWREAGAKRVILSRELSLAAIASLRAHVPDDFALEAFVHGAMCMAVSGRCYLSRYMTGRSANQGACAHPCRYQYYYVAEATRPGQTLPVEVSENGFAVFSADDLCMVEHIPAMVAAGLNSFKIEGRMKSSFYVGTTVKTYRQAIDDWFEDAERYAQRKAVYAEALRMASHRNDFSTGFYFETPAVGAQPFDTAGYCRTRTFLGIVRAYAPETGMALLEQRNKFCAGDRVTFIRAQGADFSQTVECLWDEKGQTVAAAPHARQLIRMAVAQPVAPLDMLCKEG